MPTARDTTASPQSNAAGAFTRSASAATFIIGFDTEKASVADEMIATIEAINIPIGIIGLLTSLPNTQLQRRLEREDRIIDGWAQSPEGSGDPCTAGLNFKTLRPRRDMLTDYRKVQSPEAPAWRRSRSPQPRATGGIRIPQRENAVLTAFLAHCP